LLAKLLQPAAAPNTYSALGTEPALGTRGDGGKRKSRGGDGDGDDEKEAKRTKGVLK